MKKILVLDDDEGILDVMKIVLEGKGYDVKPVASSKKIVEVIKDFSPDLILLDHWMPNFDARKTIKLIKKQNETLPIVLVSALNDLHKVAKRYGVSDFLNKPFEVSELLEKVNKNLR